MLTPPSFIHLRIRTEFSLVDSIIRLKSLVTALGEHAQPACAVSDLHNLYGLIKFYKTAQKSGIKPICACDLMIAGNDKDRASLISLYAQNEQGYRNIIELISRSYTQGQKLGVPFIQRDWLSDHNEGVIVLSGGKFGDIGHALIQGDKQEADELAEVYQALFPNRFYIELQRTDVDTVNNNI